MVVRRWHGAWSLLHRPMPDYRAMQATRHLTQARQALQTMQHTCPQGLGPKAHGASSVVVALRRAYTMAWHLAPTPCHGPWPLHHGLAACLRVFVAGVWRPIAPIVQVTSLGFSLFAFDMSGSGRADGRSDRRHYF